MTRKNRIPSNIEHNIEYNLEQFCRATGLNRTSVCELVGQGVIEPKVTRSYWYFSEPDISRSIKAIRIQRDLEINVEGAALAVELLERNNTLTQRVTHLEQLLNRLYSR
jgi:chaperone modulatory protein CbpM